MSSLREVLGQLVRVAARQRPGETTEALLVAEKAVEEIFAMPTGILSAPGDFTVAELEELKKRVTAAVADYPKSIFVQAVVPKPAPTDRSWLTLEGESVWD